MGGEGRGNLGANSYVLGMPPVLIRQGKMGPLFFSERKFNLGEPEASPLSGGLSERGSSR